MSDCSICRGAKHVRTATGWRRCDCALAAIEATFIDREIRGNEASYPERLNEIEPFPLKDLTFGGGGSARMEVEFRAFKHMVWRSLIAYKDTIVYHFIPVDRIVEIHFQRDSEFASLRELGSADLLVTHFGTGGPLKGIAASLIAQVVFHRRSLDRPTWVYTALSQAAISGYSPELAQMLGQPRPLATPTAVTPVQPVIAPISAPVVQPVEAPARRSGIMSPLFQRVGKITRHAQPLAREGPDAA